MTPGVTGNGFGYHRAATPSASEPKKKERPQDTMAGSNVFDVPEEARNLAFSSLKEKQCRRSLSRVPLYSWVRGKGVYSDEVVQNGTAHVLVFIKLQAEPNFLETLTEVKKESERSREIGCSWIIIGVTTDWDLGGQLFRTTRLVVPSIEVLHMIPTIEGTETANQLLENFPDGNSIFIVVSSRSEEVLCTTEYAYVATAVAGYHAIASAADESDFVARARGTRLSTGKPITASAEKKDKITPLSRNESLPTVLGCSKNSVTKKQKTTTAKASISELCNIGHRETTFAKLVDETESNVGTSEEDSVAKKREPAGDIIATIASWKRTHDKDDPTRWQVTATSKYLCEKTMMNRAAQLREGGFLDDYRGRTTLRLTERGWAEAARLPPVILLNQSQVHSKMVTKGLTQPVSKNVYELLSNGRVMSEFEIKLELRLSESDLRVAVNELQNRNYVSEVQTTRGGHYWQLSDLVFPFGRPKLP